MSNQNIYHPQAPTLLHKGVKNRNSIKYGNGKAIRSTALETAIFNGIEGKCGAQLKLILFLTGNADDGTFAVAEKTVCERCGMTKETYKKARKALADKGWIEHKDGKIIVMYDAIYGEGDTEYTDDVKMGNNEEPSKKDIENTPSKDIQNTHNNINNKIIHNITEEKSQSKTTAITAVVFDRVETIECKDEFKF